MGVWKMVKTVLWFELLWRLGAYCVIHPLFRGVYQAWVSSAGLGFNGGAVRAFLSLRGGLLFLLLFFGTGLLVLYEYAVIIRAAALCRRGEAVALGRVMRDGVWDLGTLRGWSGAAGAAYLVLLLPLVSVGYMAAMAPRVTIPWFILGEVQKTRFGAAGTLAVYAAYCGAFLLLLFAPVRMVLGHRRFGQAAGESLRLWRTLGWRGRLAALGMCLAWERVFTEIARYWRRNPLSSGDLDGYFLANLLCSEAFRKDFAYWLALTALQVVAMAGFLWVLTGLALTGEEALAPAWSRDGLALWDMAERRWASLAGRMGTLPRRAGAAALCLLLAAGAFWSAALPPPIHPPLSIAHRGGEGGVENTLAAILQAEAWGADLAEIDVQLTADGVPVLFHDGSLQRMAGRSESVGELTWAQLREIPIEDYRCPGAGARIASLEEVLEALAEGEMGLLIELKPAAGGGLALAEAVMELVERRDFGGRAMFMSLEYACLAPIRERHPDWRVGFCAYSAAGDIDEAVWRYDMDFLAVEEALVSHCLAARARELELPVYVWSVYDQEKMLQYLEMGLGGIITDYPQLLEEVLGGYESRHAGMEYADPQGVLRRR